MMHFEGERDVPLSPPAVWQKLSDARFLVQCVPDVETVSQAEADQAGCTIRPGLAFVRGTLELTIQVAQAVPESSVQLLLHTKGIGSTSDVEVALALAPHEIGTRVHWNVKIERLGGLLKMAPQGLIQAAAQKVIADVWKGVESKVGAG